MRVRGGEERYYFFSFVVTSKKLKSANTPSHSMKVLVHPEVVAFNVSFSATISDTESSPVNSFDAKYSAVLSH